MFNKVLVANRGEVALLIVRALCDLGVASVTVYADDDAQAPHVGSADAAVALGASKPRILRKHLLLNAIGPIIVQGTMAIAQMILLAAGLSFIGLGVQPPTPEWGTMLSDVLQFAQSAWWVVTFPGLAILLTVLAFNLMGDGLRDALDPKLKQ